MILFADDQLRLLADRNGLGLHSKGSTHQLVRMLDVEISHRDNGAVVQPLPPSSNTAHVRNTQTCAVFDGCQGTPKEPPQRVLFVCRLDIKAVTVKQRLGRSTSIR